MGRQLLPPAASAWALSPPPQSTPAPALSGPSDHRGSAFSLPAPHRAGSSGGPGGGSSSWDPEGAIQAAAAPLAKAASVCGAHRGSPQARVWSADGAPPAGNSRLVLELELEKVAGYLWPHSGPRRRTSRPCTRRLEVGGARRAGSRALGHLRGGEAAQPRARPGPLSWGYAHPKDSQLASAQQRKPHGRAKPRVNSGGALRQGRQGSGRQATQDPNSSRPIVSEEGCIIPSWRQSQAAMVSPARSKRRPPQPTASPPPST